VNPPPWWMTLVSGIIIGLGIAYALQKSETVESPNILINEKAVNEPCETILVYPTPKAKKLAKLPQKVRKDHNLHLTASTRIEEDGHSHVVSAVYAKHDGSVRLFDYKEPLPLFSKKKRTTLEASYGVSDIETTWEARMRYDAFRVKKMRIGIVGNIRGDKSYFTGVGISYSW